MLYNNAKSDIILIDSDHVLNILVISNEKELEQIEFMHLPKLKKRIPNFTLDLVGTFSHDPEKVFSSHKLSSSNKDFSKEICFAIPPRQTNYYNFMTEFKMLYKSTLHLFRVIRLSMTSEKGIIFKANHLSKFLATGANLKINHL